MQLRAGRSAQGAPDCPVWFKVTGAPSPFSASSLLLALRPHRPLLGGPGAPRRRTRVRWAAFLCWRGLAGGSTTLRVLRCKVAAPRGVGTGGRVHTTLGLQAGPVGATARRRHEQVLTGPRLYPFVPTPSSPNAPRDPTKTALSRAPGTSHTCLRQLKLIHFKIKLKRGWMTSGVSVPAPPSPSHGRSGRQLPWSFSARQPQPCAAASSELGAPKRSIADGRLKRLTLPSRGLGAGVQGRVVGRAGPSPPVSSVLPVS